MGALEQILEMKKRGIPEEEIVLSLEEQGFSPKVINDGFNQAKIKNAVSKPDEEELNEPRMEFPLPSQKSEQDQDFYAPKTKEVESQDYAIPQPQQYYQESYPQQVGNYEGYQEPSETNADIIIEVAEQVFSEKIKKAQKQLDEFNEFKALTQTKVENCLERIKRIEAVMDKLQIEILEKVGSYGENLDSIKKEMSMMQDSFGKIINPLADKTSSKHFEQKEKRNEEQLLKEKSTQKRNFKKK